jgi:hypothetical protein
MNGEWDAEALNEVAEAGRRNFLVLGWKKLLTSP